MKKKNGTDEIWCSCSPCIPLGFWAKILWNRGFTKFLEPQLHGSRRKSYLSAPFFFHLRCECLVRGRLYMPNLRYEPHHRICQFTLWNSRLSLGSAVRNMDWRIFTTWILHAAQPWQIKNRTDLFSGFWERPVLRKQTLRFQKTMSIVFWNHDGCFLSTAASDNKRKRSWKQTVLFFIFLYTLLACNTT